MSSRHWQMQDVCYSKNISSRDIQSKTTFEEYIQHRDSQFVLEVIPAPEP